MSHSDPTGGLLLGIGGGLYLFYKGFRSFREYKVLADTPRMPIRSMPMGFVHVHGKAESAQLLTSPITKTPCCFYRVEIEQWKTHDRSSSWQHVCSDADGFQFHVDDDTGRVLVDAHAAEYDLPRTQERIVDSAKPSAMMATGGTDAELLTYITYAQTHHLTDTVSRWLDHKLDQKLQRQAPLDPAKQQNIELLKQFLHAVPDVQKTGQLPFGALAKVLSSTGPLEDPEKEARRQNALQRFQAMQNFQMPPGALAQFQPHAADGRFRLREYVIVPGQDYFVSGTCCENPTAQDGHDRNIVMKGQREPTFLISSQPAIDATGKVRKGSIKMVLLGAALTLGCLALLLSHLKMF